MLTMIELMKRQLVCPFPEGSAEARAWGKGIEDYSTFLQKNSEEFPEQTAKEIGNGFAETTGPSGVQSRHYRYFMSGMRCMFEFMKLSLAEMYEYLRVLRDTKGITESNAELYVNKPSMEEPVHLYMKVGNILYYLRNLYDEAIFVPRQISAKEEKEFLEKGYLVKLQDVPFGQRKVDGGVKFAEVKYTLPSITNQR